MKTKELRNLSEVELRQKAADLRAERLNLRIQQQTGQLERPSRLRDIRRTIAKIETLLNQSARKQEASKAAAA